MRNPPSPPSSSSCCSTATSGLAGVGRRLQAARSKRRPVGLMPGEFVCATCMKAFPTKRALGSHQKAHRNWAAAVEKQPLAAPHSALPLAIPAPPLAVRPPAARLAALPATPLAALPPAAHPPVALPAAPPARDPVPAGEAWRRGAFSGGVPLQYPWERLGVPKQEPHDQTDAWDLDLDLHL